MWIKSEVIPEDDGYSIDRWLYGKLGEMIAWALGSMFVALMIGIMLGIMIGRWTA